MASPHNPQERKDRRILVIHPPDRIQRGCHSLLFAIGITTHPSEHQLQKGWAVRLPSKDQYSTTTSGLDEPCWAVADWLILLSPCYATYHGWVRRYYVDRLWELVRQIRPEPVKMACSPAANERCEYCI